MDDETLLRKLRLDAGLPPPAPRGEWRSLEGRLGFPSEQRRRRAAWLGGGVALAVACAALVFWMPTSERMAPAPEGAQEDGALVLEQLIRQEQFQIRPPVGDAGARWLSLMEEAQD